MVEEDLITSFKPGPQSSEFGGSGSTRRKYYSEYNLYLQDDTNSDGQKVQWFYFSCMNVSAGTVVRFNVRNLTKIETLYGEGLRPYVYSRAQHA